MSDVRTGRVSDRMCICTTNEIDTGRPWHGCPAHERPADGHRFCGHTAAEGCNGHGDF